MNGKDVQSQIQTTYWKAVSGKVQESGTIETSTIVPARELKSTPVVVGSLDG